MMKGKDNREGVISLTTPLAVFLYELKAMSGDPGLDFRALSHMWHKADLLDIVRCILIDWKYFGLGEACSG